MYWGVVVEKIVDRAKQFSKAAEGKMITNAC
jgi:hypothetical protein